MSLRRNESNASEHPIPFLRWSVQTIVEPSAEQVEKAVQEIRTHRLPVLNLERGAELLEAAISHDEVYLMSWSNRRRAPAVSMDWKLSPATVIEALTAFARGRDHEEVGVDWRESSWPDLSEKDLQPLRRAAVENASRLASTAEGSTKGQTWFVRRTFAREWTRQVERDLEGGPFPSFVLAYELELLFLRFLEDAEVEEMGGA